MNNRIIKI